MWCLWALPLLGLAGRASSEGTPPVSCNGAAVLVQPPLWVKIFKDEAHFVCSPGYKVQGQNILTCINTNWDHKVPTCEKLPTAMIKMKCPYNHTEWTLKNLDLISQWLLVNEDQTLILNREYIDDSLESQRLAAEMLARFNDPFFRFYGLLPTFEKGVPMHQLLRRFQESSQFLRLRKRIREEFDESDFNDIDEDENVLIRYYGLHYQDVLERMILPYSKLITVRPQSDEQSHTVRKADILKTTRPESTTVHVDTDAPTTEQVSTSPPELPESLEGNELSTESVSPESSKEDEDGNHASKVSGKKNVKRARGDIEKFIPVKEDGKDYFRRPVEQVLTGRKAEEQMRHHRESYIDYLRTIVQHIINWNVPKSKWPEYLKQYDLEELSIVLKIDAECIPPERLGFELVSNGTATLEGSRKVVIRCNPGFYLRGARELFCDGGRWLAGTGGMPTCVSQQREPQCGAEPRLSNGRAIKSDGRSVVYECFPGFAMVGTNMLVCTDNRWVPSIGDTMPVCDPSPTPERCGPPPVPANGHATEPHFMSDNQRLVVRYFCDANYSMSGPDYSICVGGQWTPNSFRCVLSGQDEVPGNIEMPQQPAKCQKLVVPNASVKYYEDGRSTVRVTCLPGYKMVGASLIRCVNGAYVDPIPKCVDRISLEPCPAAVAPSHGSVQYVTENAIRFSCDPGYVLRGRDRAVCYQGQWSDPAPDCVLRAGCDNSEPLLNKNLVGYVYSNGRWLECADRFEMIGGHHQYCRTGRWEPEPTCVTSDNKTSVLYSEFIDCPLPEAPPANGIEISSRGRKVYYRCKLQDTTLRGERMNECVNGRWSHPAPYCERGSPYVPTPRRPPIAPFQRCSARPIRGGEAYVYSEGRVVIYQCKFNYLIRGETTLNCERSQWSAPVPQCYDPVNSLVLEDGEIFYEGRSCPPPPKYPGTTFMIRNRGLRIYSSCIDDPAKYAPIECVNGRWVGTPPQCGSRVPPGVCEPQEIPNGKFFLYSSNTGYIQCRGKYVIENTTDSRSRVLHCDSSTGRWDLSLELPKCVPQPQDLQDDRPYDDIQDSNWDNRQQVDECGPPQVSSKFTFYIQGDGRSVALKCKKRAKRSLGLIKCTEGSWEFAPNEICDSDCALDDVKIENGIKVVYDENEYVFQCLPNYELIGAAVAHCPEYQPNADYNTSFVQQYGPDFIAPECRVIGTDPRPISRGDIMDSDSFQTCRWLAEFGSLDLKPTDYFISNRGRVVTWRDGAKENTAECQNGMWVNKAIQVRDKCSSLPTEPDQGTYFLYEDYNGISVYFQCFDGYRLSGSRVSVCGSSRVPVPDCYADSTVPRYAYAKVKNPSPTSSIRCPRPPEYLPNAEVTIHYSGDMYAINCNPGFLIESTRQRFATVRCTSNTWYPEILPRCLRDGERTPRPSPGGRHDLFGRRLPQLLTGEKARRQDDQLREQFRNHAMQLVEFAKARNRELRRSGVPPDPIRERIELPIVSGISDEERDKLFRENEQTYREIEALLASIKEERNRQRRQNLLDFSDPALNRGIIIPPSLQLFEAQIKQFNLTQADIEIMDMLGPIDRARFLDEKENQREKSKSDPVRSQDFLRKFMSKKTKQAKTDSAEENKLKSVEIDNSIDHLEISSTTESTTGTSKEEAPSFSTVGGQTETSKEEVSSISTVGAETETSTVTENPIESASSESTLSETMKGNSTSVKKGYDDSCRSAKAPEIENGYVLSYELLDEPEGKVLQANYRCFEDYTFQFEHTAALRCRNGHWVGEHPNCIPEDDEEEADEEGDGSNSLLNKLK